jgi:hypothetical protein
MSTAIAVTANLCDAFFQPLDPDAWRNEPRGCEGCQNQFMPRRKDQKHCNGRCRTRAYRNRLGALLFAPDYFGA